MTCSGERSALPRLRSCTQHRATTYSATLLNLLNSLPYSTACQSACWQLPPPASPLTNHPHFSSAAGTAYDGYLSACTLFLDASGDGALQAASEASTLITDGAFSMQVGG